jgi:hypothetical protein
MPVTLALRRLRQEDCEFEIRLGYTVRCYGKKRRREGRTGAWQVIDCLPSKFKALSSNICTITKKNGGELGAGGSCLQSIYLED